jgi:hypothetical protein
LSIQLRINRFLWVPVVVQDQVPVQLGRQILLDGAEEVAELPGTVSLLGQADDLAGLRVECGEQAGGAAAPLVVGAALIWPGRIGNSGAVRSERLGLRPLVHTDHQRTVRRVKIQADDIGHLVDQRRIAPEPEGLYTMGRGKRRAR